MSSKTVQKSSHISTKGSKPTGSTVTFLNDYKNIYLKKTKKTRVFGGRKKVENI